MHVVVIGAGVFGSWTALWLRRRGASVTLVDQYGPGNALSSSGDESRVTRSAHGADAHYPLWQRRSLEHWLTIDPALFIPTGVLWLAGRDDGFEADSVEVLERLAIPHERLDGASLRARYPQLRAARRTGPGRRWIPTGRSAASATSASTPRATTCAADSRTSPGSRWPRAACASTS